MKHMELKQLFLQDVVKSGELQLMKTPTQANPADMLTKAVTGPGLRRCLQMLPGLSHQDWPEDELGHMTSTAHAMLVEVLTEQEQALSLSCVERDGLSKMDKEKNGGMSMLESVLLCAVLFEAVVIACLYMCARCSRRSRGKHRTVATQSPTTYTELRGAAQPRFQVLPETSSGAWSD